MKYYADDPIVARALNRHWLFTAGPMTIFIIVLFLSKHFNDSMMWQLWAVLILFAACACLIVSRIFMDRAWFRYYLKRVDDPGELADTARRWMFTREEKQLEIAKKCGIDISLRTQRKQQLPDFEIEHQLKVTNEGITIKGEYYNWSELTAVESRSAGFGNNLHARIFLDRAIKLGIHADFNFCNPQRIDYYLLKYFRNSRAS